MVSLRLSRVEARVLRALKKASGEASTAELVGAEGLERSSLMSALERLASKGLVRLERFEDELLELTPEGLAYVEQGLPERRLYEEAARSPASPSELGAKLGLDPKALTIALGWARRKGWVKVEGGVVKALEAPRLDEDEVALSRLARQGPTLASKLGASEECVKRLKERSLVASKPVVEVRAKLVPEAWSLVETPEAVELGALTSELIKTGAWATARFKPYDVRAEPYVLHPGKRHPYLEFLDEVKEVLVSMGFVEHDGPFVETEFWNFDILFQAQDHPAREIHDSFRVREPSRGRLEDEELVERVRRTHEDGWTTGSKGWGYRWSRDVAERLVLRTQTTAVSMRYLASHPKPPVRMFCLSRVFRPDVLDAKHSMEFMQLEGIYGDHGVTLRHLLGIIEELASALGLGEVRFKPGYFPFTEPSVEGFVKHPKLGWVEFVGSGMFRPEVLKPLGVEYPVAAWGIGIERLAMVALGIDDIRELYTRRLDWLRARPVSSRR
ncbi:MAG: phenylalanine--tRNA ligase subunit alpha [Thermoprotei archaeon]|nr:MAG: phenylalanine--tRNA ligase subunit alpha [Thermoprotei archaeon]